MGLSLLPRLRVLSDVGECFAMSPYLGGLVLLVLVGCGRYFPGPIQPAPEKSQEAYASVEDDGTIVAVFNRLEISLRPMTDEELNRQFADYSMAGANSKNPYTFGNWKPLGDTYTPPKYTVFSVQVKNYEYPKVHLDPARITLVSQQAGREYDPLNRRDILEFYASMIPGYAGNAYSVFQERREILTRTMYPDEAVFSGQEVEGYVVFPALPHDINAFTVHLSDVAIRFDFRQQPIETIALAYRFQREVFRGYQWVPE